MLVHSSADFPKKNQYKSSYFLKSKYPKSFSGSERRTTFPRKRKKATTLQTVYAYHCNDLHRTQESKLVQSAQYTLIKDSLGTNQL